MKDKCDKELGIFLRCIEIKGHPSYECTIIGNLFLECFKNNYRYIYPEKKEKNNNKNVQ
jgi:hypothetical protein